MDSNFTMETYQQDKTLHIDLNGVFDGASAFALVQELEKEIYHNNNSVYVETQNISKVCSFGKSVLSYNIPQKCKHCICFSGEMANQIAPEGSAIRVTPLKHVYSLSV